MKKEAEEHSERDPFTGRIAFGIMTGGVLLSLFLSFLGGWQNPKTTEKAKIEQAAAQVEKEDPFLNYRQLEDPLLVLVNDRVPLPENYRVTPRMVDDEVVDLKMYADFSAMCKAAAKEEVWFWVASGYRSEEQQKTILEKAKEENLELGMEEEEALKEALKTIQRPGHSEHHTGLAVDLNEVSDRFETTAAYAWLSEHAADYGFIERYRKEKAEITGIERESWHYRYVGKVHAREMKRLDLCLEEYVLYLKKQGAQ